MLDSFKRLPISQRITISTVALLLLAILASMSFLYQQLQDMRAHRDRAELEMLHQSLEAHIKTLERTTTSLAEEVALTPGVAQMVAEGRRDELLRFVLPAFTRLRESQGIVLMQFHLPPATSFCACTNRISSAMT